MGKPVCCSKYKNMGLGLASKKTYSPLVFLRQSMPVHSCPECGYETDRERRIRAIVCFADWESFAFRAAAQVVRNRELEYCAVGTPVLQVAS